MSYKFTTIFWLSILIYFTYGQHQFKHVIKLYFIIILLVMKN